MADGSSFGDLGPELVAAGSGSVLAPLLDHGLIRASGPDAADFLHNLLTNDIKGLGTSNARSAGMCTAKGRLLAVFLVWRDGDDFLLMLPREILPSILKKLSMYVLRAKVKLTDASAELNLVGFASVAVPPAPTLAELPRFALARVPGGRAIRLDQHRWLLALEPVEAVGVWQAYAGTAHAVGTATWQWLEIAAGQPRVVAGTQEAFVPQMLNMELPAVGGVSFTKGCYPGQEIVARTQYLGKVKRRSFRARVSSAFAPGTHVYAPETGEQHCGAIVSLAPSPDGGHECLVCVQIGAQEGGEVRVGSPAGERLEFLPLPYNITEADAA
ncbi:MAG: folate-binding protein YgfZ [Rhodocyclales bacterium]|nr:folate-binding protein YgfZ [Rhodocyclales bacterium]